MKTPRGWRPTFGGRTKLERPIAQQPYTVAGVWKNAHDGKTWCAGVDCHGHVETSVLFEVTRFQRGFKRRLDAIRWANRQIPVVKAALARAKRQGAPR